MIHFPSTMMKDEQDSGPIEIYEDTSNSDSYGASFDRSSYVVVRTDSDLHRRLCRTSATNDSRLLQNRRRCGSVGEEQPELQIDESAPRADRGSTIYSPFGDHNFLMVEPYKSMKVLQAQEAAEFMDGREFLSRDNVFRGLSRSLQKTSTQQKRVKVKESRRVKRSSSHRSGASSSFDAGQIESLFHQLHTSSNAPEKLGQTIKESEKVNVSGGRPFMSPRNEQKEDHGAEPTTVRKKPNGDNDETKRKKAPRKHKKQVKEYTLQPVIPPPEIHVSDNVTVASSIGGLSQFPQPKRPSGQQKTRSEDRHERPTLNQHVAKQNSFTEIVVSQPMPHSARDGFLPRPPTRQQIKSPKDKVPLESVFQSPREIDVSDPTIVSALTEYVRPTPNRRPQQRTHSHY